MTRRRMIGIALLGGCAAGLLWKFVSSPDFPTEPPVARVDAALIERLRAEPGLHLALADGAVFEVQFDLREDGWNRRLFGTEVDLREAGVARRAIHIQRKGGRAAIHADRFNPMAGPGFWLLHNTVDAPVLPLGAGLAVGFVLALGGPRRRRPQGA